MVLLGAFVAVERRVAHPLVPLAIIANRTRGPAYLSAPALVFLGLGTGAIITTAFSLGPVGARPADSGVAAALVNSSNQVGGSLGAALLNTIAATAAANYLTHHRPHVSLASATVHGDVTAFTFLAILFAVGAVVAALLFPVRASVRR